jgi:hypothetical protein
MLKKQEEGIPMQWRAIGGRSLQRRKRIHLNDSIHEPGIRMVDVYSVLSPGLSENQGHKGRDHEQHGGGHVGKIENHQYCHGKMNPRQVFYDHKDARGQRQCQKKNPDPAGTGQSAGMGSSHDQ